ncbi:MAG: type II secretion system F family protein [Candidatus Hydrogenedentes bacterium]|nr:type II secretion system F family protein [Candidatus Hydrogenedentota bacterium]
MTDTQCHPDLQRFWQLLAEGWCAGQPLLTALRSIQKTLPLEPMGRVVGLLADEIEQGHSLSAAMKTHPSVFGKAHICLIEGGELLGIVDRVLLLILEFTWRCSTCGNLQLPGANKNRTGGP